MRPAHVAIVAPDLARTGGIATVVRFLADVVAASDRFSADLLSLALSASDRASVQLRRPRTWTRGVQVRTETTDELSYDHVGAVAVEIEACRYRPRAALTERLSRYDLVQVVAGTPAWAHVARAVDRPVALQVASLTREERRTALAPGWHPLALWRRLMAQVTDRLDHRALDIVDAAFVENQWMYDHLTGHMPSEDVMLAPPGVDTDRFTPGDPPSAGEYVLSVGRFGDPRKNVTLLFEAYARLCDRLDEGPRLVLAGLTPPPDAAWTRAEQLGIRDRIAFHEKVPADTLRALYGDAALYVVSSDEEGLGLTILEAMASGRPVVSTDCGGPATAVVEGKTGLLTPVGDAAALAEAMATVLRHPERADAMGGAGRRRAVDVFSQAATGQRFLDTYDKLLSTVE
jgi:glycosyltransferase involved in cell wall biosynthesis